MENNQDHSLPQETRGDEDSYLRFGHESQAHYHVPLGDRSAYVLLARPKELTRKDHFAFENVLRSLEKKLAAFLAGIHEYEDQKHVEPQLRVFQPGKYLQLPVGEDISRSTPHASHDSYLVLLSYGSHRHTLVFPSSRVDMQTTRRAINRLLETALKEGQTQVDGPEEISVEFADQVSAAVS